MPIEHRKLTGDMVVDGELTFHGMATGSILVKQGGTLKLHGMCGRDVVVEQGAYAYLYGMVGGNVVCIGGFVQVFGTVQGYVLNEEGDAFVDPGAMVLGGVRGA